MIRQLATIVNFFNADGNENSETVYRSPHQIKGKYTCSNTTANINSAIRPKHKGLFTNLCQPK